MYAVKHYCNINFSLLFHDFLWHVCIYSYYIGNNLPVDSYCFFTQMTLRIFATGSKRRETFGIQKLWTSSKQFWKLHVSIFFCTRYLPKFSATLHHPYQQGKFLRNVSDFCYPSLKIPLKLNVCCFYEGVNLYFMALKTDLAIKNIDTQTINYKHTVFFFQLAVSCFCKLTSMLGCPYWPLLSVGPCHLGLHEATAKLTQTISFNRNNEWV